jgi:hypothetical protein
MNPRPIEAEAIDNKTLLVKFHNGEMKKVDFWIRRSEGMKKSLKSFLKPLQPGIDGMFLALFMQSSLLLTSTLTATKG